MPSENSPFIQVGCGRATGADALQVGREAAAQAVSEIDPPLSMVLLFSGAQCPLQEIAVGVRQVVPEVPVFGATSSGEILNGPFKDSAVVVAIGSRQLRVRAGIAGNVGEDWHRALDEVVRTPDLAGYFATDPSAAWASLARRGESAFGLVFSNCCTRKLDSFAFEISEELKRRSGQRLPLFGAVAGDDWRFDGASVLLGDRCETDGLLVIVCETGLRWGMGMAHGFTAGPWRSQVSYSFEKEVIELDRRPAAEVLVRLGPQAQPSPAGRFLALDRRCVLGIPDPYGGLVANLPGFVSDKGSVRFLQPIAEGSSLISLEAEPAALSSAAAAATRMACMRGAIERPVLALAFSNALRPLLLKYRTPDEIAEIRRIVDPAPVAGFYSMGELGQCENGTNHLQSGVMSVLVIGQELAYAAEVALDNERQIELRIRDEQRRRHMEQRMLQMQKLDSLGAMAGGIAHDFNNLLMGILGSADLAAAEVNSGSRLERYLSNIQTNSLRAAELCRQMLAYSGQGRFIIAEVDINALVLQMRELLESSLGKKARLEVALAEHLPTVVADAGQIRQLLVNLVTNAAEAVSASGGWIRVRTGSRHCDRDFLADAYLDEDLSDGLYVIIEVEDNGVGVDPGLLDRIFDPFFSTKFTGRGLGLAATLGIVRGHKGAVKVSSQPGRGTCFQVLLPAREPAAEQVISDIEDVGRPIGRICVLLADDEESVRQVASRMLERLGAQVLIAKDGIEALDVFRSQVNRVDLILLDVSMPRMDGLEALRLLREIRPDIPVVLTSGYGEQEIASRLAEQSFAGFIQKPYRLPALERTLRTVFSDR